MTSASPAADPVAADPDLPDDLAEWHRLSPRMLLVHPITEIGRALPALVGVFFAGRSSGTGHYWTLGVAAAVAVFSLSRWFTTRLRITPQYVQLRHGLLRRRTVSTARDRIRTVDVTAHVLHRALGLSKVVIGTGTNDRKGKSALVLDGLDAKVAVRLRQDLLHAVVRTAPVPTGGPETDSVPVQAAPATDGRVLARLEPAWIRFAPFTLSGVVTGVIVWGFVWRVQGESQVDVLNHGPLRELTDWVEARATLTAVLVVVVAVALFVALTSTAGYLLAFWGFRLIRHDGGTLEVRRGLLTTRSTSIERARLAGVHLTEPLPLRWAGAARTTAVATGLRAGRGAEIGGEVLLPPAPLARARSVAREVLDGSPAVDAPLARHPAAARRRRIVRGVGTGVVLAAAAVTAALLLDTVWPAGVGAVLLVASVPLALDRAASLGHVRTDGYVVSRYGSLVRRRSVLAESAVIGWTFRSSVLQRRQHLVTVQATTAAGRQGYPIVDVDPGEAIALADAVSPGLFAGLLID